MREPLLEQGPLGVARASAHRPCALRARRGAAIPWTAAPSQAARIGRRAGREVTGPPWPFALNPLTPQTSGGRRMHPDQGPGRDSSQVDYNRLRDFPKARTGQCPSRSYLRDSRPRAQVPSASDFEALGERFGAADERRIGTGGTRRAQPLPAFVDQLVGEQQRTRTGTAATSDKVPSPASASRLLPSTRRAAARRLSSSPSRHATWYVRPGDRDVDHRGHQAAASRISSSSSSTTSRTLARSSSSRRWRRLAAGKRALDPLKRALRALQCRRKTLRRPSNLRYAS